jgi:D-amino peptidase
VSDGPDVRIVISADMEGTAGVVEWDQVDSEHASYQHARLWMIQEVNAAVAGAIAGGATEVIVNDSHGPMTNLLPDLLDRRATLISGHRKPFAMAQGLDAGAAGLVCTGYHARASTPDGVLAHTFSLAVDDVRLNGRPVGEIAINAMIAGHFGVPVLAVTGDRAAVRQAQELLGEGLTGVSVKNGITPRSARSLNPEVARDRIRERVAQAVANRAAAPVFRPEVPIKLETIFSTNEMAERAATLPEAIREGRSVTIQAEDALTALRRWRVVMMLGNIERRHR